MYFVCAFWVKRLAQVVTLWLAGAFPLKKILKMGVLYIEVTVCELESFLTILKMCE
jgi:hypothetical protein